MVKRSFLITSLSLLILLFLVDSAFALEITYPRVPGMEETPKECLELPPEEKLACYVKYIYHLSLSISGLVCFFAIISGGVLYLVSGGSVEKIKDARERISVGFLGAILLLFSYSILHLLNPQLVMLRLGKEEVGPPVPPTLPPIEEEIPTYVEIPLGWLIERVKTRAQIVETQAGVIHYLGAEEAVPNHASLKQLAQCLKKLTNECKCSEADTENCQLIGGECEGECVGDPCDRPVTKNFCQEFDIPDLCTENLREAIERVESKMGQVTSQLAEENEKLEKLKIALKNEKQRLELAEVLMRDASPPPTSRHDIAAIDKKEIKTLEVWEKMEPTFSVKDSGFAKSFSEKISFLSHPWFLSGILFPLTTLIFEKKIGKKKFFLLFFVLLLTFGLVFPSLNSTKAQEEVDLLPYFLNTRGNHICSGEYSEYFYVQITGPNEFKICKSLNCAEYSGYYEKFRYDDNYIYHMEDTTWATATGNVKCSNTNHDAFYRRYDQYGINCNNYQGLTTGAKWVPRTMRVGEDFFSQQSVVGFDKLTGACCPTQYSGDFGHHMKLIFHGTFILPNGVVVTNGIILKHESTGENFYFDDQKGWIGFDRGIPGTGAYIHGQVEDEPPPACQLIGGWEIGIQPVFPELPKKIEDDPATFYVLEAGNEDLIEMIETVVFESDNPSPPPDWEPPPPPPPPTDPGAVILNIPDLRQTDPRWASEKINDCNDKIGVYSPPCNVSTGCGCGPTSLTMILRYFGYDVYPDDVATNLDKNKEYFCGQGSSSYGLAKWAKENYALSFEGVGFSDLQTKIREGKPVMAACKHFGKGYGLDWAHISVIKGVEDGFVYFQDSVNGELIFAEEAVRDYFSCYSFHAFSGP